MIDSTTPSSDLVDLYRNLWRSSSLSLNAFCTLYGLNAEFMRSHVGAKPKKSTTLFYLLARS